MLFQVGIGSLGGNVFFQIGHCARLRTMPDPHSFLSPVKRGTKISGQDI